MIKIGDSLWIPRTGQHQVKKDCPVCFQQKFVTVILGDGTHIKTDCEYCGKGFEGPQGTVTEYSYEPRAELFLVTEIKKTITGSGEKVEYQSSHYIAKEGELHETREAALLAAEKLARKQKEDAERSAECIKANVHKSFSWNVGFHRQEAKRNREQAEYHDRKAVLCKERSKP